MTTMTADRFRQALDLLEFNSRDFAAWIDGNDRTVRRWAAGKQDIPHSIGEWLEGLASYLEQHPKPRLSDGRAAQ